MAKLIGVDIPSDKKIKYALMYIKGLGPYLSDQVLQRLSIDPDMRTKDLTEDDLAALSKLLQSGEYVLEGNLKREVVDNINRLKFIGCYRGRMHTRGLPTRGQRTKRNARTRKGKGRPVAKKK